MPLHVTFCDATGFDVGLGVGYTATATGFGVGAVGFFVGFGVGLVGFAVGLGATGFAVGFFVGRPILLMMVVGAGVTGDGSDDGQNPLHFQLCAFAVVSALRSVQSSDLAH